MNAVYIISFLIVNVIITVLFVKRFGDRNGILTYGYVGLITFFVNSFFWASILLFFNSITDIYDAITADENYNATVIQVDSEREYNSDDGTYETMYTPTIRFRRNNMEVISKRLNFSSTSIEVGDTYRVSYIEKTDTVVVKGGFLVLKTLGSFIFCFIFSFIFAGEIRYIFNKEMSSYYDILRKAATYFFIPLIMIGFNIMLIYALFDGKNDGVFVSLILIFFILVLTLSIVGYFKMLITKEESKIKIKLKERRLKKRRPRINTKKSNS